jgi:hypothetical protein
MADASNAETIRVAKLIDQLCDEFEQGWVRKSPARIEDLVPVHPEPLRCVLFRELLAIELEYRAKDGHPVAHGEAHERFNRHGPWVGPSLRNSSPPPGPTRRVTYPVRCRLASYANQTSFRHRLARFASSGNSAEAAWASCTWLTTRTGTVRSQSR